MTRPSQPPNRPSSELVKTLRAAALTPPSEILLLRDVAADRIEELESEVARLAAAAPSTPSEET